MRVTSSTVRAVALGLLVAGQALLVAPSAVVAVTTSQWYATDLHVHDTFSADARPDLGIVARNARAAGLNAVFLTDHNQASDFPISSRTANNAFFDAVGKDDLSHWTTVGSGVTQVSSPVHSGTAATKLTSTGSEQYLWTVRGPNLRPGTGAVSTTFSIDPTTLGSGGTFAISASFGGDVTIQKSKPGPEGYTLASTGVAVPCKSVVFMWYLGSAPDPARYQPTSSNCSASPIPPVVVKLMPITTGHCDRALTLNTWNTCTLDVSAAVASLAAADQPVDYLGLSELKVGVMGPVTAYVDDFSMSKTVSGTIDSRAGAEFVARNALIGQYDDAAGNFRVFPSLEEGITEHAQRFNFGITSASQYTTFCNGTCNYSKGVSGIAPTKASGYPGQLNHPGVSGGVSDSAAVGTCSNGLTPACGADVMEVRQRNMAKDWDTILKTGKVVVGDWGSDNHTGQWSGSSQATFLYAPSNSFDDLMGALYEGRAYVGRLGTSTSQTRVLFDLGSTASQPYPGRYPVYVPVGSSVTVHATISSIKSGDYVRWVDNGTLGGNITPTSGSYSGSRTVTLSGSSTYSRIEVGPSATADADAMSEAILLLPAASGVPAGMSYHVERVTPPAGTHPLTSSMTRGITASSWDGPSQSLSMTLSDAVGSLAEVQVGTSLSAQSMTANGATVGEASSLTSFQAATGASWFQSGSTVYLKAPATTGSDRMVVSFGSGGGSDVTPPTAPGTPHATSVGTSTATIAWTRSSDDVAVTRYDVSRDGTFVGTAAQPASGDPSFSDTGLSPGTTYQYVVTAFDAAGHSTASPPGSVTTQSGGSGGSTTLNPTADAKVDGSTPTTNYGTVALRVDASPDVRSYLKFNTSGISGTVDSATLRIWATSAQSVGFDVYAVSDSGWTETGLTSANQPSGSIGAKLGSSGSVAAGTWKTIDVTSWFTTLGVRSIVLRTTSSTALALSSREDATHPPQLVITSH
jgi:hypothetical protein